MRVLDSVEGSACRLATPGSSLQAKWQVLLDDESGAKTHFYMCSMVLCGEEGQVELVVPPVAIQGEVPVELPELRQALIVLPGTLLTRPYSVFCLLFLFIVYSTAITQIVLVAEFRSKPPHGEW